MFDISPDVWILPRGQEQSGAVGSSPSHQGMNGFLTRESRTWMCDECLCGSCLWLALSYCWQHCVLVAIRLAQF